MAVSKRGSVAEGSAPVSEVVATLSDGHKVKRRICGACYRAWSESENMGNCPRCHHNRALLYIDPVNIDQRICHLCYEQWYSVESMGICPKCNAPEERALTYNNPDEPSQGICQACYKRGHGGRIGLQIEQIPDGDVLAE